MTSPVGKNYNNWKEILCFQSFLPKPAYRLGKASENIWKHHKTFCFWKLKPEIPRHPILDTLSTAVLKHPAVERVAEACHKQVKSLWLGEFLSIGSSWMLKWNLSHLYCDFCFWNKSFISVQKFFYLVFFQHKHWTNRNYNSSEGISLSFSILSKHRKSSS